MGNRFVRPDTTRLAISQGDWLIVKRRLSAGEQRQIFTRLIKTAGGSMSRPTDGSSPEVLADIRVEPSQVGLSQVLAYLLDWSLTDAEGNPVVIRNQPIQVVTAALDALDVESYNEIEKVIQAHEVAMLKEREIEKKQRDGVNNASAISPSPSAVTGELIGSVS